MALPFLPLLVGAAAGATMTYVVMNKTVRQKINQSADQVADTIKSGVKATKAKLSGKNTPEPAAAAENAGEQTAQV